MDTVIFSLLAILGLWGMQQWLVKPYSIPSESMMPTLAPSDRILVNRRAAPGVGDIVVFHPPVNSLVQAAPCLERPRKRTMCAVSSPEADTEQTYVKRIVGTGGDHLQLRKGRVWRNGKPLPLYGRRCRKSECHLPRRITVPEGHFFVMGDNRADSYDSRYWGPLPSASVIGVVMLRFWPPSRLGGISEPGDLG